MHLCYVAHIDSIHTRRWVSFFVERGHRVSVITDVAGDIPGVTAYRIGDCLPPVRLPGVAAVYQIVAKAAAVRRVVHTIAPDIVHGHYTTNYGFLAALSGFQPLVQTVHGSDIMVDAQGAWEQRWFVRYALRRAALITSAAEHITERVVAMGIPPERVLTLQYGVDTDVFRPPPDPADRLPRRVVSTRMFEWKYNIQHLIRAIPAVQARVPDVEVVLAGDGPDREALCALVNDLGIGEAVRMTGRVAHDRMPALLQSAAVYVSTSVTDGASLSLLEAMACGAFPVATDIPANRPWITDGENGFLVKTDDEDALVDRIARALTDTALRTSAARRNAALIRERGDYRTNMGRIETMYERLCASPTSVMKT